MDTHKKQNMSRSLVPLSVPPNLQRYDHLYKIILIGDQSVGKTNLTFRFCDNLFGPSYVGTIGIDFKVRTIEIDGTKIKLQIWDTAGQERFQTITQVYYRGSNGVIFVYDITDRASFEHLRDWIKTFEEITGFEPQKIILGNKADKCKQRQVSFHEGEKLASQVNARIMESSAKTGYNVENAFLTLAKDIKLHQEGRTTTENLNLKLTRTKSRKRKSLFSKCVLL